MTDSDKDKEKVAYRSMGWLLKGIAYVFKAAFVNDPTALPTTEAPMDFLRSVGITRTPASEKIGQVSTDTSITPGIAENRSTPLILHIFSSSRSDSWDARFVGSEIPMRTYTCVKCRAVRSGLKTHAIQISTGHNKGTPATTSQ